MIYLDNNATTRVAPEVFEAMQPYLTEVYGNPSSAHTFGRQMREAVENAREQVALLLGAQHADEIVFTSGGSESDNWRLAAFSNRTRTSGTSLRPASNTKQCENCANISASLAVK